MQVLSVTHKEDGLGDNAAHDTLVISQQEETARRSRAYAYLQGLPLQQLREQPSMRERHDDR
jgi:hypothetical protein